MYIGINQILTDIDYRILHLEKCKPANKILSRLDELKQFKNRLVRDRLLNDKNYNNYDECNKKM
ncbi:unnamed protein product [marine sediment metagenome]|uniref:Uncharacterized protein n=1 Tax=marine sediment metagenome TaxID=412755 RepID=X0TZK7_9ZZZZ